MAYKFNPSFSWELSLLNYKLERATFVRINTMYLASSPIPGIKWTWNQNGPSSAGITIMKANLWLDSAMHRLISKQARNESFHTANISSPHHYGTPSSLLPLTNFMGSQVGVITLQLEQTHNHVLETGGPKPSTLVLGHRIICKASCGYQSNSCLGLGAG